METLIPHKCKYSSKLIYLTSGYSEIRSIDLLSNLAQTIFEYSNIYISSPLYEEIFFAISFVKFLHLIRTLYFL